MNVWVSYGGLQYYGWGITWISRNILYTAESAQAVVSPLLNSPALFIKNVSFYLGENSYTTESNLGSISNDEDAYFIPFFLIFKYLSSQDFKNNESISRKESKVLLLAMSILLFMCRLFLSDVFPKVFHRKPIFFGWGEGNPITLVKSGCLITCSWVGKKKKTFMQLMRFKNVSDPFYSVSCGLYLHTSCFLGSLLLPSYVKGR